MLFPNFYLKVPSDWENRTQGVWVSPLCPKVSGIDKNSGDSLTGFKKKLLDYLNFYKVLLFNFCLMIFFVQSSTSKKK